VKDCSELVDLPEHVGPTPVYQESILGEHVGFVQKYALEDME